MTRRPARPVWFFVVAGLVVVVSVILAVAWSHSLERSRQEERARVCRQVVVAWDNFSSQLPPAVLAGHQWPHLTCNAHHDPVPVVGG